MLLKQRSTWQCVDLLSRSGVSTSTLCGKPVIITLNLAENNSFWVKSFDHVCSIIICFSNHNIFENRLSPNPCILWPSFNFSKEWPLKSPTAYFNLSHVVLRHDIPGCEKMSEAYPHLIFHNLTTQLGKRCTNILKYLFPVPKEDSKRVITFSNHEDSLSFR